MPTSTHLAPPKEPPESFSGITADQEAGVPVGREDELLTIYVRPYLPAGSANALAAALVANVENYSFIRFCLTKPAKSVPPRDSAGVRGRPPGARTCRWLEGSNLVRYCELPHVRVSNYFEVVVYVTNLHRSGRVGSVMQQWPRSMQPCDHFRIVT
jgi:hypothetical protein